MRSRSTILPLLGATLLLMACTKDPAVTTPAVAPPAPPPPSGVFAGDTTGLFVTHFGDRIYANPLGGSDLQPFDIDGDGTQDIQFRIVTSHSLGCGFIAHSFVRPLHAAVSIGGYVINDTNQTHMDTVITTGGGVPAPFDVEVFTTISHGCHLGSGSQVDSISYDIPKHTVYASGDSLSATAGFVQEEINLRREPHTCMQSGAPSGDTLFSWQNTFPETCYPFPLQQPVFLAVKFEYVPGQVQLGWVRIEHRYAWMVILYESAVGL